MEMSAFAALPTTLKTEIVLLASVTYRIVFAKDGDLICHPNRVLQFIWCYEIEMENVLIFPKVVVN